eukprot:Pgem_evm1s1149
MFNLIQKGMFGSSRNIPVIPTTFMIARFFRVTPGVAQQMDVTALEYDSNSIKTKSVVLKEEERTNQFLNISIEQALKNRDKSGTLRKLTLDFEQADETNLIDFCSNDYLGFAKNPVLAKIVGIRLIEEANAGL